MEITAGFTTYVCRDIEPIYLSEKRAQDTHVYVIWKWGFAFDLQPSETIVQDETK